MTNLTYKTSGFTPFSLVTTVFVMVRSTPYDAEQPIPTPNKEFAPRINPSYVSNNVEAEIRFHSDLTGDPVVDNYRPRTELGRKLLALRGAYVIAGGQLLDDEALGKEVQLRRGGLHG